MKTIIGLIRSMFAELTLWGRFWLIIGLATLAAAAAMSFDFGWQVSAKHALFLGLLSIVTAFAPEASYRMYTKGKSYVAAAIAIACAPFFMIEFYSHAGYTAGLRGVNVTEGYIQKTKWTGAQSSATEDETSLKMWQDQLAKLQAEAPWAATVKADAMRGELEAAEKAIELEAKRGGCKSKCQALMEKKGDLEKRIGQAEQMANITARMEATQRILDKKRDVAAATEYTPSVVAEQNAFLSKAVALALTGGLEPTEVMLEGAQQTVSLSMALAGTFLPAFALFLAGLYRRDGCDAEDWQDAAPTPKASPRTQSVPAPTFNPPRTGFEVNAYRAETPAKSGVSWRELNAALWPDRVAA